MYCIRWHFDLNSWLCAWACRPTGTSWQQQAYNGGSAPWGSQPTVKILHYRSSDFAQDERCEASARANTTFTFLCHHSWRTPYSKCMTCFILAREKTFVCTRQMFKNWRRAQHPFEAQKREYKLEECKLAELEHSHNTGICTRATIRHTREFPKTRAGQELRFISINPPQPWIPGEGVGWWLIQGIKMPPLVTPPIATKDLPWVGLPPKQQSSLLYGHKWE